ncbi:MAG: type II toxin-antitoxin system VapC family toxin [Desulfurococcales archaeon]|nr:type II toxin-antitoxin system VapC family toxin [Desulfurococcales archaeon]
MREQIVYLDSSAIVKRYIREPGSDIVRELYLKAYSGEIKLSYSVWNIGEVLGALDRARGIGRIDNEVYSIVKRRFLLETRRMLKLGLALMVPLKMRILRESWSLIEKHHVYEADAVQIASARYVNASQFLTGDRRLHEVAVKEKLNSTYLV